MTEYNCYIIYIKNIQHIQKGKNDISKDIITEHITYIMYEMISFIQKARTQNKHNSKIIMKHMREMTEQNI